MVNSGPVELVNADKMLQILELERSRYSAGLEIQSNFAISPRV